MRISVILAHPDPESFNAAIASAVVDCLKAGRHEIWFHDLYRERFDPLLHQAEFLKSAELPPAIREHCRQISQANGIIIMHPNWWGQPPAILKGWIDRVIRPGIAYMFEEGDSGQGVPLGLLKAETALLFNTSNTPSQRETEVFGDPLERIWKDCVFGLCGVRHVHRRMFEVVITSTAAQRERWLQEAKDMVRQSFPPE